MTRYIQREKKGKNQSFSDEFIHKSFNKAHKLLKKNKRTINQKAYETKRQSLKKKNKYIFIFQMLEI